MAGGPGAAAQLQAQQLATGTYVAPAPSAATPGGGPNILGELGGLGAGGIIGGILGAIVGSIIPGVGTAAGAIAGASLGASIAGSVEGAQANTAAAASALQQQKDTQALQASQLKTQQDLAEQQRQAQLTQLATTQKANLAQFQTEQATALESETGQLGQARLSLDEQIRQAGMQMVGQEAQAAQQSSAIAAAAAARGIKLGPGISGSVVSAAEGGAPSAATGMPQLQVAEQATGQIIGAQKEQLASTQSLAFGSIAQEQQTFTEQQGNALAGFQLQQSQQMSAAQLSEQQAVQSASLQGLQLSQTQTLQQTQVQANLQSYDQSQWLGAFTSILGMGQQAIGKLYNPPPTSASLLAQLPPGYTDAGGYYPGGWGGS